MLRFRHVVLPVAVALVTSWVIAVPAHASGGTSYTWIGSSQDSACDNHSWSSSCNWSPNGVPGNGDSVLVAEPDNDHCTAYIDGVPTVSLAAFSLASTRCGSRLTGGSITVTRSFAWDGGALNTPTMIAAGASGTLSGTNGHGNRLGAELEVAGSLTLSGLSDAGPDGADTALFFYDVSPLTPRIHILAGGTLASRGSNQVESAACCNTPAKIVNDGRLSVSTNDFDVAGVEVDQHATLHASSGGRLVSDAAPLTAGNGATYSGVGGWFVEDNAALKVSGTQTIRTGFHLELGGKRPNVGAYLGGTGTLTGAGILDWTGGTVEGNLTLARGFHVHLYGLHDPAHGNSNGRQFLSGTDRLSGNAAASVTNHGTITVNQGTLVGTGWQAKLVNASDGTVWLAPGTRLNAQGCCTSPDKIINHGTLTVPTGSSRSSVALNGVAYQSTGTTSIASGRTLQMIDAPSSLSSATVRGGGTLADEAPTAVSGTITLKDGTRLNLRSRGSLDGRSSIGGAGSLRWTGGSVTGAVTVTVGGGVAVSGPDPKYLSNIGGGSTASTLTLNTHVFIAPGTKAHHDYLAIEGLSTLTLANKTTVGNHTEIYAGKLVNTGSLTIKPGTGGTVLRSGPLTNRGTVTVSSGTFEVDSDYIQGSGHTRIAGRARLKGLYPSRTITLNGGVLDGTGTVAEGVTNNAGTVEPAGTSTGTLHISGDYIQAKHGVLALTLNANSRDLLAVAGAVTLAGTLTGHNLRRYRPHLGTKVKTLSGATVTYSLSCATTSGTAAKTGHWAPNHSSVAGYLTWRKGTNRTC